MPAPLPQRDRLAFPALARQIRGFKTLQPDQPSCHAPLELFPKDQLMSRKELPRWGFVALMIVYAGGAWAACTAATDPGEGQVEVCVVGGPSYAGELFGAGSDDVVLSYMDVEAINACRRGTAGPTILPALWKAPTVPRW